MTSEVTQDAFAKDDNGISDADCISALLKEYAGDRRREGFPKTADTLQRGADLLTEASHRLQSHRLTARQSGEGEREALRREIINTPETADFMAGVPIEAAHQRERWGADHDAGKTPFDWFWLIGFLAQKAANSAVNGNIDKALHHTISTAAALANWHAALSGADTAMRPGIAPPASLDEAALRATDDAGGA